MVLEGHVEAKKPILMKKMVFGYRMNSFFSLSQL